MRTWVRDLAAAYARFRRWINTRSVGDALACVAEPCVVAACGGRAHSGFRRAWPRQAVTQRSVRRSPESRGAAGVASCPCRLQPVGTSSTASASKIANLFTSYSELSLTTLAGCCQGRWSAQVAKRYWVRTRGCRPRQHAVPGISRMGPPEAPADASQSPQRGDENRGSHRKSPAMPNNPS